jgi:hypothetical protein
MSFFILIYKHVHDTSSGNSNDSYSFGLSSKSLKASDADKTSVKSDSKLYSRNVGPYVSPRDTVNDVSFGYKSTSNNEEAQAKTKTTPEDFKQEALDYINQLKNHVSE